MLNPHTRQRKSSVLGSQCSSVAGLGTIECPLDIGFEGCQRRRNLSRLGLKSIMNLDDHVCLCFHVSKRKVLNFIRVEKPVRASQLSECQGAGTGCGWCRALLTRLVEEARKADGSAEPAAISAEDYATARTRYLRETGRQPPPGATPAEDPTGPAAD